MLKFLIFCTMLCCSTLVKAQNYEQAIGVKFPGGFSVTYKKFITQTDNLEGQVTLWNKGFRVSGLYEFNFYSFHNVDGLSWFAGPGVHLGFWKDAYKKDYNSSADFGIDGIIGLDYKFTGVPLNMSLDWQPSITLAGNTGFTPSYGGIGVRYTF